MDTLFKGGTAPAECPDCKEKFRGQINPHWEMFKRDAKAAGYGDLSEPGENICPMIEPDGSAWWMCISCEKKWPLVND